MLRSSIENIIIATLIDLIAYDIVSQKSFPFLLYKFEAGLNRKLLYEKLVHWWNELLGNIYQIRDLGTNLRENASKCFARELIMKGRRLSCLAFLIVPINYEDLSNIQKKFKEWIKELQKIENLKDLCFWKDLLKFFGGQLAFYDLASSYASTSEIAHEMRKKLIKCIHQSQKPFEKALIECIAMHSDEAHREARTELLKKLMRLAETSEEDERFLIESVVRKLSSKDIFLLAVWDYSLVRKFVREAVNLKKSLEKNNQEILSSYSVACDVLDKLDRIWELISIYFTHAGSYPSDIELIEDEMFGENEVKLVSQLRSLFKKLVESIISLSAKIACIISAIILTDGKITAENLRKLCGIMESA